MLNKILAASIVLVTAALIVASAADRVRISDPRTIGKWKGNEQAAIDIDKALDALDAESVTAATAATVVTPQAGATVTATAVATPQSAAIAVTVTPGSGTVLTNVYDGVTNEFTVYTNWTATVTAPTNVSIAVTVANGAGLLTNATAVTTLTLTK